MVEGRDDDVLGIGMARGIFSDQTGANDGAGYTEHAETAYEVYYSATINDSMTLSPTLQYIVDPGGTDAVVYRSKGRCRVLIVSTMTSKRSAVNH